MDPAQPASGFADGQQDLVALTVKGPDQGASGRLETDTQVGAEGRRRAACQLFSPPEAVDGKAGSGCLTLAGIHRSAAFPMLCTDTVLGRLAVLRHCHFLHPVSCSLWNAEPSALHQ